MFTVLDVSFAFVGSGPSGTDLESVCRAILVVELAERTCYYATWGASEKHWFFYGFFHGFDGFLRVFQWFCNGFSLVCYGFFHGFDGFLRVFSWF